MAAREIDGTLSSFTRDKTQGWLFQPADGSEPFLIVAPKTKFENLPDTYGHVLGAPLGK